MDQLRQPKHFFVGKIKGITLIIIISVLAACTTTWPTPQPPGVAGGQVGVEVRSQTISPGGSTSIEGTQAPPIIVIHVPGISGIWPTDRNWAYGLQDAGINDIRKFEWTGPNALLNLFDDERHARKAQALAQVVRSIRAENKTGTRIIITAHSGGTRIALRAIELLAEDNKSSVNYDGNLRGIVEQVWLIAAALDPDYDLTTTLDYVARLVSIQSSHDAFILGIGTSIFGTADNFHGDAAGKVGFNTPDHRLEVWEYDSSWRKYGAGPGHLGVLKRRFAGEIVGPSIIGWPKSHHAGAIFPLPADAVAATDTMGHDDESN